MAPVVSSDVLAPPLRAPRALPERLLRVAALARREGPVLLTLATMTAGMVLVIPLSQLMQDSWLTLVSGREIVQHGLFARDSLTAMTHGQQWVDQQWLAQVLFYGATTAGGVKLAMILHYLLLAGSFGFAMAVARRRGASPLATGWVGALSILVALWGWQMRSQNFSYPLFVGLLALLMFDGRAPSRRVFWTVPILVVWANLHGSVLLGITLVWLYALTSAATAWRRPDRGRVLLRCGALAGASAATVFASPYGFSLVDYYRSILANKDIKLIMEWRPAWEYGQSYLFYGLLAVALYLVIRHRKRLQPFEILVLLFTAVSGFQAVRNIVWFAYACVVILPVALDATWLLRPHRNRPRRQPSVLFVPLAVGLLVVSLVSSVSHSDAWYQRGWPPGTTARVDAELRADPHTTVWATERFADWLLWKHPALAGQVAYDARFEMVKHKYFRQIALFRAAQGRNWHAVVDRYDLVVLSTTRDRKQIVALTKRMQRPRLYADGFVTVLGRAPKA